MVILGYIYKITNLVNSKIYIGQTARTVELRWNEHLRRRFEPNNKQYNLYLYKSIRKYGKDNFIIESIESCDNNVLDDRETFWIDYYNSAHPDFGYNLTLGGGGNRTIDYEEIYRRYDTGELLAEISDKMGIGRSHLTQILKGYVNYSKEQTWERSKQHCSMQKGTPVCQYDLMGNFIATFPSSKAAERNVFKTNHTNIIKSCKNKNCLSGGFQWRFLDDLPPGEYVGPHPSLPKTVYQIDKNYQVVAVFTSSCEASLQTGIDQSSINRCCNHKRNYSTAGGYIWRYEDDLSEVII